MLTITEQDCTAAAPGLVQLLFQRNLRNVVLGGSVDQVANGQLLAILSSRDLKIADLVAHGFGGTWTPLRVVVGVLVSRGFLVKELENHPAQSVFLGCEGTPLFGNRNVLC